MESPRYVGDFRDSRHGLTLLLIAQNVFAFSGEAKNQKYAVEIIHECHEAWRKLVTGEVPAKTADYDLSM